MRPILHSNFESLMHPIAHVQLDNFAKRLIYTDVQLTVLEESLREKSYLNTKKSDF